MKLFLACAALMLTITVSKLYAQTDLSQPIEMMRASVKSSQVINPAPEAAELGKYGNAPVNLSTGSVNISIPLFELKGTALSLPITLSFGGGGFKPQDRPTWVGQGWSLNAGGVITRGVRGNPDDAHYFGHTEPVPLATNYWDYMNYLYDARRGEIETQPDLYYYNFNKNSGKFGLTKGTNPTVIKVTEDMTKITTLNSFLDNFTATDLDGTTYQFDQKENTVLKYGVDFNGSGDNTVYINSFNYPSAWYVSTMTSADGTEQLKFEYWSTSAYQVDPRKQNSGGVSQIYTEDNKKNRAWNAGDIFSSPEQVTTMTRKFLRKISLYKNSRLIAYVDFLSDTNRDDAAFSEERVLRGIRIYSAIPGHEQLVKAYDFKYGYYFTNSRTIENKRLRLDTLQEVPVLSGTTYPQPYIFEYAACDAPQTYTYGIDHWGFYNGTNNTSITPRLPMPDIFDYLAPKEIGLGANREPTLGGSEATMLTKITYPTGGYSTFEYELHQALNSVTKQVRDVGGVRIAKMVDYAGNNQPAVVKTYRYINEDGTCSGVSDESFPKYINVSYWQLKTTNLPPKEGTRLEYRTVVTNTGNALYGLGSFPGGHIGYTRVEEITQGLQSNEQLGKTVYEYTFRQPDRFNEYIANGDLIKQSVYDNGGQLLQQTTNKYGYPGVGTLPYMEVRPLENQDSRTYFCFTANDAYTAYDVTDEQTPTGCWKFKIFPQRLYQVNGYLSNQQRLLLSTVTKIYDKATRKYMVNSVVNEYNSPSNIFPIKTTQYTGGDQQLVTKHKYVGDPLLAATEGGYQTMVKRNLLSAETETFQYREDTLHQQQRVVGGKITYYGDNLKPSQIFTIETNTPVPMASFTELNANGGVLNKDAHYKPAYNFFYNNGDLVSQQKYGDIAKSYTWDYNNMYPTAEVTNSDAASIAYTGFESNWNGSVGGWSLKFLFSSNTEAYTGLYSAVMDGNNSIVKTFATPTTRELVVSYWAKNGSLTVAYDNGSISPSSGLSRNGWNYYEVHIPAGITTITITGAANIDELRCYPASAQMNSYAYKPFAGMLSATTPINQTLKYEYDGLNRLVLTRNERNNIVQQYAYSYGTNSDIQAAPVTLYYNASKSAPFTRTASTCPVGSEPSTETYVIPYGKYASAVSLDIANTKAQQDITANGRHYADSVGVCWFYSNPVSGRFSYRGCPDSIIMLIKYTVPARTCRSTDSQAAADSLAVVYLQTHGQSWVDANGSCTCDALGEGYKSVNGVCTKGARADLFSTPQPGGGYICTYRYEWTDGTYSKNYTQFSNTICNPI